MKKNTEKELMKKLLNKRAKDGRHYVYANASNFHIGHIIEAMLYEATHTNYTIAMHSALNTLINSTNEEKDIAEYEMNEMLKKLSNK